LVGLRLPDFWQTFNPSTIFSKNIQPSRSLPLTNINTRFTRIPRAALAIDEEFLLDVFDNNDLLELLVEYWQESIQTFLTAGFLQNQGHKIS
jgi:hypothetical protein